jgi:hypothetical protein
MTVAAMQMAGITVWAHRLSRVWMRRQSLNLPDMFSILWRYQESCIVGDPHAI